MKRKIDKNRPATGRNLWRTMLVACMCLLTSLSSFGQDAPEPLDPIIEQYLLTHESEPAVKAFWTNPTNPDAIAMIKMLAVSSNPDLSAGMTAEEIIALRDAAQNLFAQVTFLNDQISQGVSLLDAQAALERRAAEEAANEIISAGGPATTTTETEIEVVKTANPTPVISAP